MEITSTHKGQTVKTATVKGATPEDHVMDAVLDRFKETRDRLEGWTIIQHEDEPGSYTVHLYTA